MAVKCILTGQEKVNLSGDTMTGDLKVGSSSIGTNGYVEGTWLRTTAAGDKAGDFATIDNSGWIYKRKPANVLGDIGGQAKITANGILKGDGTGNITAADETEVELVDLPIQAEAITIPKGRMRGDVDGDGKITENDVYQIDLHTTGSVTLTGADLWCADANANNTVNGNDAVQLNKYITGAVPSLLTKTPTFADYYNNWTYVKIDDLTGYWTAEIPIAGLTTSNNVVINICETLPMGQLYKAEISDGKIKIYATKPPIKDISAIITISSGNGKISMPSYAPESEPEIFWATYGSTPVAAIKEAWDAGKLIKVKNDRNIYDVNKESDSLFYFYGLDGRRRGGYTCGMVQASGWSISEKCGYIIDIKGAVTLPTASWTGSDPYTQTVTTSISTANTKVDIQPSEELYDQLVADNVGYLAIKNVDGTLTAVAKGGKPSVDLDVQVTYNPVW